MRSTVQATDGSSVQATDGSSVQATETPGGTTESVADTNAASFISLVLLCITATVLTVL